MSGDNFVELDLSFHLYVGSGAQTLGSRLVQQTPSPTEALFADLHPGVSGWVCSYKDVVTLCRAGPIREWLASPTTVMLGWHTWAHYAYQVNVTDPGVHS